MMLGHSRWCVAVLCVFALTITSCRPPETREGPAGAGERGKIGSGSVGLVDLRDLTTTVPLEEFRGKIVLYDFWATWCPPCRSEIPSLNRLHSEYKARGVEIVGMTVDRGSLEAVAKAALELGPQYRLLYADDDVQQMFGGIRAVPTKFLVDPEGRVRKVFVGVVPEKELRKELDSLLASVITTPSLSQ